MRLPEYLPNYRCHGEVYYYAFSKEGGDYQQIVATWNFTVSDRNRRPTALPFAVVEGSFLLLNSLDTLQCSATRYLSLHTNVTMYRDMDNCPWIFPAYVSNDEKENRRSRTGFVPNQGSTGKTLMENVTAKSELNLAKKTQRFTNATDEKMRIILSDAGRLTSQISKACYKVFDSYPICNMTNGRLIIRRCPYYMSAKPSTKRY